MPYKDPEQARAHCRVYGPKYRRANLEKRREALRLWRLNNPDKQKKNAREYSRKKRAADPQKFRRANQLSRGLPAPARPEPKYCECCAKPASGRSMHLDHCHVTGLFRGWLCSRCNKGIGLLGDNIAGLYAATAYLQRNAPKVIMAADDESRAE